MRTRTFRLRVFGVIAAASLIGAACGGDDDDAGDTAEPASTTADAGVGTTTATTAVAATTVPETSAESTEPPATEPDGTTAPTAPPRGDADLVIWADDTRQPVIEAIAATFAEENGITVAVQELEFGQIREQLSLAAPAGNGPDIVIGAHDWLGELVANGVVEPLDVSGVAANFQQVALDAFTYEGQTYGLPYAIENVALVRNTDFVPEAPATFEEMVQVATDFKAQHADDPTYQGLALQIGPEGDAYHLQPFLSAFGGYIFGQNEDGTYNPDDLGIDSDGGLAAAQFLSDQSAAGLLSADTSYDVMIESFGSGKAAFAVTGPWALSQADNGFVATGVPYEVTPIPAREGGDAPQRVRRRAGLHDLVVLRAEGPGDELRARLHEPGVDPARAVRDRRPRSGADVGVRPGERRRRRRRFRPVRCGGHPAAGDPRDEQRVDLARPGRGQHAARRRPGDRVQRCSDSNSRSDRRRLTP